MFKKIVFLSCLLLMATVSFGALTDPASDIRWGSTYTYSDLESNTLRKWVLEVDSIITGATLENGNLLTFDNGGTISNVTDSALIFGEAGEDFKWVFGSTSITATSSSGIVKFDWGAIVPAANQILLNPSSDLVGTPTGSIRYDTEENVFYGRTDAAEINLGAGAGAPSGGDTTMQYNDGGSAFGAIAEFIYDDTNIELADDFRLAMGTSAEWLFSYEDADEDTLSIQTAKTASADPDIGMLTIAVDTGNSGLTANQEVFEIGKGGMDDGDGLFVELFAVDEDGDVTIGGDLSLGGTFYQASIAAAASGNTNLTINAGLGGSGTITLGNSSTGKITTDNLVELLGNVDLGDTLASDTLSILAKLDQDLYLDDDTGDSPALVLRDAGEATCSIVKKTGATADTTVTIAAASDFSILVGNLSVGDGSAAGTAAMDGLDFYVAGDSEFDGNVQFDGAVTAASTLAVTGTATFNGDIAVALSANGEEILVTGTATNTTADNLVEFVMAAQDTDTYVLALTQTPDGDGNNDYLICADTTGSGTMFTIKDGGETAWTLDPAVDVTITGAAHTSATGMLNIDFDGNTDGSEAVNIKATVNIGGGGAQTMSALYIDLDDDADAASTLYGIRIIPTDVDGSATVIGIDLGVTLDVGMNVEVGAGLQAMTIDAATVDHTGTNGVIDIEFDSKTNGAEAINIKATYLTASGGGSKAVAGMEIELVNNGNDASDILYGLIINVSDSSGTGKEKGIYVKGTGIDAAFQADFGYIRVGTGGTPTITLSDDDIYAEGTIEADGGFNTGTSTLMVATVDLTAANIRALVSSPFQLVAAPSGGEIIEFISALLILNQADSVFTESGANDDLAIEYSSGSGATVSETIEMTGFIDQSADQITRVIPVKDPFDAAGDIVATNLVLAGLGDNFGGNGENSSTLRVIITYRIVTALGL